MIDLMIYESGNGGELSLKNGDIETTDAILNQPYLSHFGGNTEANTTGDEVEGTERFDWFGNEFLESKSQMNSNLERSLINNSLSSSGRVNIESDAKKDIEFLSELGDVSSEVLLIGNDKVKISDKINKTVSNLIWDATKSEIIEEITI